jgi:hypothetical protein
MRRMNEVPRGYVMLVEHAVSLPLKEKKIRNKRYLEGKLTRKISKAERNTGKTLIWANKSSQRFCRITHRQSWILCAPSPH